jgi:hypothetical protein
MYDMFARLGIFTAVCMAAATPALAQSCAGEPIAPAFASTADIQRQTPAQAAASKHDAFVEIKNWQRDLKSYRDCLTGISNGDRRQLTGLDPAKDADKIAQMQQEAKAATHEFDRTVDMEERVVNEFHALQAAYCARTDVDRSSCPK